MLIDAKGLDYAALNKLIKSSDDDCKIENCLGQRFIADGLAKAVSRLTEYRAMHSALTSTVRRSPSTAMRRMRSETQ